MWTGRGKGEGGAAGGHPLELHPRQLEPRRVPRPADPAAAAVSRPARAGRGSGLMQRSRGGCGDGCGRRRVRGATEPLSGMARVEDGNAVCLMRCCVYEWQCESDLAVGVECAALKELECLVARFESPDKPKSDASHRSGLYW